MTTPPDEWGLNTVRLICGFGGSVVHIFTAKKFDPVSVAAAAVVGTLTANFLGPAVQHFAPAWLGDSGASFLTGYLAIVILQAIETAARSKVRALVDTEIER